MATPLQLTYLQKDTMPVKSFTTPSYGIHVPVKGEKSNDDTSKYPYKNTKTFAKGSKPLPLIQSLRLAITDFCSAADCLKKYKCITGSEEDLDAFDTHLGEVRRGRGPGLILRVVL